MLPGFMPVLHLGSTAGAPWWDMWDDKITARMEEVARRQIVAVRDDPRLIGYYTDNEMGWWNATLFKMTLEHAPTSGQRRRLIELLRKTYDDDWQKLLADFEPAGADSWDELDRGGRLHVRAGSNGVLVMRRFLAMVADRYYELAHDIIRKHDRRALILGDRYQSFYYPEVARAAGRHMDVVSTNLNAHWNDGTFLRCYLDTLHKLTGKPILVSEFYAAAAETAATTRTQAAFFQLWPHSAHVRQRPNAPSPTSSNCRTSSAPIGSSTSTSPPTAARTAKTSTSASSTFTTNRTTSWGACSPNSRRRRFECGMGNGECGMPATPHSALRGPNSKHRWVPLLACPAVLRRPAKRPPPTPHSALRIPHSSAFPPPPPIRSPTSHP
jgi:hypothetical protein